MVEYVDEDAPLPPALSWAFKVRKWGNPTGGGWYDWPAGMMRAAQYAEYVHRAYSGYRTSPGKTVEWTKQYPDAWKLVSHLLEERMRRRKAKKHDDTVTGDN